jgi:CRISPR-associated exonuclease Cas4
MKITGTMIYYYFTCKRELWFFYNKINFDFQDENELIGRLIDEESYKKYFLESNLIDNTIKIDRISKDKSFIIEVKKSNKLKELYKKQLLYYLYYLKENYGLKAKGKIYYEENKEYEIIELTEEDEREIKKAIEDIKKIVKQKRPPKENKKPYCKNCSYFEFCWI